MLPGKKYTPGDVAQILRRRIWLLLVPLALVSAGTAVVARKLPDRYRSDTLILVVPQKVPESYVRSTVTTQIEERLQAIQQQILSRTRLERIIQDFNLYAVERRTGIMEDIVEAMRRDIHVQLVKGDAFRVSYIGENARTVQKVTERLASLFIEESLRDRELLAEGTNQFLETQLEDARRRLLEHEKKVEAYRLKHAGQLPSQLESNLQTLQNIQSQLQTLAESMNRDHDRRNLLERQIADLESQAPFTAANGEPGPLPANAGTEKAAPQSAAQQLAAARVYLAALQARKLTDQHPDVIQARELIRELEKKANEEALATPLTGDVGMPPAEIARRKRLADLRADVETLNRQLAQKQQDELRLREQAAIYERRVEGVPARESEMVELSRDYTTLQGLYTSLLGKREESKISANLERRQIGESFKLLDPARVPERPISPNRRQINLFGMLAGLGIGLGLIALLEYRDSSFKTEEEITRVLALPVLAVVPVMQSARDRFGASRRRLLVNLGLGGAVAGCFAVLAYTFLR